MMTEAEIKRCREARELFVDRVQRSITSADSSGRTVESPHKAADYVGNALLVHETDLLALAAVTFARAEVLALLAEEQTAGG